MIAIRNLPLILLAFLVSGKLCGQINISGLVLSKQSKSPLAGVSVIEKGSNNGTFTSDDGTFDLIVLKPNTTLIFSYIGFANQEIQLNGQSYLTVKLKIDCIRDFFDHQVLGIYTNCGLINTPLGGKLELSFPAFLNQMTLKSGFSVQSNLGNKEFFNAQIALHHLVVTCRFDTDINWYYRKISWQNELNTHGYSFEVDLNFNRPFANLNYLKLIVGYSELDIMKNNTIDERSGSGALIGLGTWIGRPINIMLIGKVAIYESLVEYHGEINRQFGRINTFAKLYKVESFTELSLGVGYEFTYRFKRQRI